jgi:ankyrin repeat protein
MTEFREQLLEAGADPNVRAKNGITPLMRAVWHNPTTPLKQLIEFGADLNARDAAGRTALRRALDEGKLETADFLKQQGAAE